MTANLGRGWRLSTASWPTFNFAFAASPALKETVPLGPGDRQEYRDDEDDAEPKPEGRQLQRAGFTRAESQGKVHAWKLGDHGVSAGGWTRFPSSQRPLG